MCLGVDGFVVKGMFSENVMAFPLWSLFDYVTCGSC